MSPLKGNPVFEDLLANNRAWVEARRSEDPDFFRKLAEGQAPPFLMVGCSDSRKCINSMIGTRPGQFFIHRNIGNQVLLDDPNVMAVLEFGILHLQVKHVVVAGHSRCGGVEAALEGHTQGAVGSWLRFLRELRATHDAELLAISDRKERIDRLSELNVIAQAQNVLSSPSYREAKSRGRAPEVHGWLFSLETGLIRELELPLEEWRERGLYA